MIKLKDITTDTYTNASGYSFYLVLSSFFKKNEVCNLSFEGINACSSSFLNSSFGQLIEEFGMNQFKSILKIHNINKVNAEMVKGYINSFSENKVNK